MKQYFTVKEANRQLPLIEPILNELQKLKAQIIDRNQQLKLAKSALGALTKSDSFFTEEAEIEFLLLQATQYMSRVEEYGAEVKDIESGLIDFYTMVNGEEAYLCWRMGEPEILYWHRIQEGFIGRKPVSMLEENDEE